MPKLASRDRMRDREIEFRQHDPAIIDLDTTSSMRADRSARIINRIELSSMAASRADWRVPA